MANFELILRNGIVRKETVDVGVAEGKIVAIESNLSGSTEAELDLAGKHLFPGFIDAHVHFNEPGRTEWEGFHTGSRALAAGGGTVFCDMPLNSSPPVLDADSFEKKRNAGEAKSKIDFALWGGLVPGNTKHFPALAELGAVGLKAFMAHSGLDEFPRVTPDELRDGMEKAAQSGLLVAVHAESQELLDSLSKTRPRERDEVRNFLRSRPVEVEVEAIRIACELAGETGCVLHIVHVSSAEGISEIQSAKAQGVDVSAETCPHYSLFCEDDMIELGAIAKCAPPLRNSDQVEALNECVESGWIDTIGSDHSPSPPDMKSGSFRDAWGGISSCQHAFPTFLDRFPTHDLLITDNPAQRMGLDHRKGQIAIGNDADFAVVNFSKEETVSRENLLYRHPMSPYTGRTIGCRVEMTFCRGRLVHGECNLPTRFKTNQSWNGQFLARREPE